MSKAPVVGMTLLLLGSLAACSIGDPSGSRGTGEQHETTTGAGQHRHESSQQHSGGTSRSASPRATPTNTTPPPYIARVVWVSLPSGRSLQVYPTANGRVTTADGSGKEAWREVLRKAPDAGSRGMRAQFECHWAFARLADPDKPSWNLEPWRPVVSAQVMYDTRCNPGGPEV
ncbi:DUF2599 domain-containing protein [Flexivirga sp. B27]